MIETSEWIEIPTGPFLYGDEKERRAIEQPYRIGRYPVTNAQYLAFVEATGHAPPHHWPDGEMPVATHPVVCVTWYDACAYAKWVGGRLPTEEEWERAARGTDGREYPWGDEWEEGRCNTCEAGVGGTTPVGEYSPGDSPDGCADMAGNVWEWTASKWGDDSRVVRGGSWINSQWSARCAFRDWGFPGFYYVNLGFRVVVSLASGDSESCVSDSCPRCAEMRGRVAEALALLYQARAQLEGE